MNTEAHLAIGWILAHLGGRESRRFRALVTFAALAPDLDVISYFFGERAYATCHHAVGHNIFFSFVVSAFAMAVFRRSTWPMLKILLFTQLGFYSHYFGDYFFTRFPLEFFWPLSSKGYIHSYRIGLDHPINLVFGYLSFVSFIVMGIIYKRTPIELVHRQLDARIVNLFRRKTLSCHICSGKANERCECCGLAVCPRHARMTRRCTILCSTCHSAAAKEAFLASK